MTRKRRRYGARIVVAALVGVAVLASAIGWLGSSQVIWPRWYEHRLPPEGLRPLEDSDFGRSVWQGIVHDPKTDLGLEYEDVEFPTADGSTLRGWLVDVPETTDAGIVAVHGGGGDRREFLRHAPLFHEGGYPLLLFDCREHGTSDGAGRGLSFGVREHEDVMAAVGFAREELGWTKVGVIGTSMGGASAILAAAKDRSIDAVVAENPFTTVSDLVADTRFVQKGTPRMVLSLVSSVTMLRTGGIGKPSPIDVVGDISPRPLLLIHGAEDDIVPPSHSQRLYERAGEPKELWIAPGSGHVVVVNDHPEEYRRRVIRFFDRWLRRARPEG